MDYNSIKAGALPYTGAPDVWAWIVCAVVICITLGLVIRWAVTR